MEGARYRVGLVLEGGGTKGAYASGFLQVLHERGVTFDAVAGTSVGALNALLWSTGNTHAGVELWQTITQERIFPFRIPRTLAFSLVPFVLIVHTYDRFRAGLPPWDGTCGLTPEPAPASVVSAASCGAAGDSNLRDNALTIRSGVSRRSYSLS